MAVRKFLQCTLLLSFCTSIFAATLPTETFELSPSLESSIVLTNGSTLTNLTGLAPLGNLPPDPFLVWPWSGSKGVAITFSNYVPGIWNTDALNVIIEASRDAAIQNFRGSGNKVIGRHLAYTFGTVNLTFKPSGSLTWSTWGLLLSAFTAVFNQYEYTGFSFAVADAYRPAGSGVLGRAAMATPNPISVLAPVATPEARYHVARV